MKVDFKTRFLVREVKGKEPKSVEMRGLGTYMQVVVGEKMKLPREAFTHVTLIMESLSYMRQVTRHEYGGHNDDVTQWD